MTTQTAAIVAEHLGQPKNGYAERVERDYRIPVVASLWPRCYWILCLVGPEDLYPDGFKRSPYGALEATDDELAQIASYIDFKLASFYLESYGREVRELLLPLVGGHNTVILLKRQDGWGYKRMTWETGSWPHSYMSRNPPPPTNLSLLDVLDHIEDIVPAKWVAWKRTHPVHGRYFADVFDADGLWYVFDAADGGAQACGPFDGESDAETTANNLNTDNDHPEGLRPHMVQNRLAPEFRSVP